MWLDPDHACNLTDRVRAGADQAVSSNFTAPVNQWRLS